MTTSTSTGRARGGETTSMSAGAESTKRWFPEESDFDSFVDGIIEQAETIRESRKDREPSLFGEIEAPACRTRPSNRDIRGIVSQAFLAMFDGLPEDHVVIEPEANSEFIARCRLLGAEEPESKLNRTLLNVRKAGWHTGIVRGQTAQLPRPVVDRIGYAAEMAARLVQLQSEDVGSDSPTVDRMMCDPDLRVLFDEFVQALAPGFTGYQYRLAAFAFRKSGRASTLRLGASPLPDWDLHAPLRTVDLDDVPTGPGLYTVVSGARTEFVSASLNLRARIASHLAVGEGRAIVPPLFRDPPRKPLELYCIKQPAEWRPRRAEAVACRLKAVRRAQLNLYSAVG